MFDYRTQGFECCKTCSNQNKLKCVFCEDYSNEEAMKLYNEQKLKKGCSTCAHCKRICNYPSYVEGEECICMAGLECDTVYFTVNNCKEWRGKYDGLCN